MTNFTLSLLSFTVFLWPITEGKIVVTPFLQDRNKCDDICKTVTSYIPVLNVRTVICERGCRFFNIIYLTDGNTINSTKRECQTACKEAYDSEDFKHCIIGCEATLWKQNNIDFVSIDGKHSEGLRKLVMAGVGIQEKSLYLKPDFSDLSDNNSTDWYECIRWRGKLTKIFLFSACLIALISFLLFSLLTTYIKGYIMEKQAKISNFELDYVDSDTESEIIEFENRVNQKELVKLVAVTEHEHIDKHLMV